MDIPIFSHAKPAILTRKKLLTKKNPFDFIIAEDDSAVLLHDPLTRQFSAYKIDFAQAQRGAVQWDHIYDADQLEVLVRFTKTRGMDIAALADQFAAQLKVQLHVQAADAASSAAVQTVFKPAVKVNGNSNGKCTNTFLEDDGFCVQCGEVHKAQTKKALLQQTAADKVRKKRKLEKRSAMLQRVNENELYKEAFDTAEKVLFGWGLDVIILFREMDSLCFSMLKPSAEKIYFSYATIERSAAEGFEEMTRLAGMLRYRTLYGKEAAHQIALHNCAHVIAVNLGERQTRNRHGEVFKEVYTALCKAYPFHTAAQVSRKQIDVQRVPDKKAETLPAAARKERKKKWKF